MSLQTTAALFEANLDFVGIGGVSKGNTNNGFSRRLSRV
jgi:hypothetical protein